MRPDDAKTVRADEVGRPAERGLQVGPVAARVAAGGTTSSAESTVECGVGAARSFAREEVERAVRDAVSVVAMCPFNDWPADRPLAESPDLHFDSVTRLEILIWIERGLGIESTSISEQEMDTIGAMTTWLLEWQAGGKNEAS